MRVIGMKAMIVLLAGVVIISCNVAASFAAGKAIEEGHWAYKAIDDWGGRGLLAGYAKGKFTAPARLTRFEVAALTLRAAEGMGQGLQEQGEILEELAAPAAAPGPEDAEAARLAEEMAAVERGPGVYAEDIAMLEKLVAEFRTELAALGVKVEELEGLLAGMEKRLGRVEEELRRHQVSGYLQFRFTDDEAAAGSNFSVRRARVTLAGPVSAKTSYKIQFQADKEGGRRTVMRYGWIDVALSKEARLRAGQAQLPIGYELLESSSARLEPERAFVMDRLFSDQGDIGLQWHRQADPRLPAFDVAIVNGTGINASDDNDRKDVVAGFVLPYPGGSFTVAAYDGRTGRGATAQDKERLLAGIDLANDKTRLRGEYVRGRDLGEDVAGWYARLSRQVTERGTLYVKYEEFDENRGRNGDLLQRWSAGWVEEIDARTRLSLSWETRQVGAAFSEYDDYVGDAAVLQLQAKF